MTLLIVGLVLWCSVHFIPGLFPNFKSSFIAKAGENAYKGAFSLMAIGAIVLIVFGWKATTPVFYYNLGPIIHKLALGLVAASIFLITIAQFKSRFKQFIRHPQLTGAILWAVAHLLMNGDSRSVLLFSTIGLWAVAEIFLINRREGKWVKPDPTPIILEVKNFIIAAGVLMAIAHGHIYLAGVPVHL